MQEQAMSLGREAVLAISGGAPVRRDPWPTYDKGSVCIHVEDEEAAMRAVKSHRYFRYDDRPYDQTECGKLEMSLARYFGVKHALAVSSGTAALALAIMAAGIPKGSWIACPGFTFTATPSAIVMAGCRPYFVEVDEDLNFDVADLRARWCDDIKAIMVVHMRGFASDVDAILRLAEEKGVPVFEDAVPALGASLKGRKLGTFGLAGAFSTQSDKSLNSGEGGFLLTNDAGLAARAIVLSGAYEGKCNRHFAAGSAPLTTDLDLPLLSLRMDEIRAAIVESELRRLQSRLDAFKTNYEYVAAGLADLSRIHIRQPVARGALLGEAFIFTVARDATWFARALTAEGVDARNLGCDFDKNVRVFWNWRFLFDGEGPAEIQRRLPRTSSLLRRAVDVPLSSNLTRDDCDDLIRAVRKVAAYSNL